MGDRVELESNMAARLWGQLVFGYSVMVRSNEVNPAVKDFFLFFLSVMIGGSKMM